MKVKPELNELIKTFGLKREDVWDCHGTMVMLHKACETVAQAIGVKFDTPQVLYAEGDSIAIMVAGHAGEDSAWSIGEASPKNNKNSYPWAMAEKRAKDRVILKLARFSEVGVYSDIEADDFKKGNRPVQQSTQVPQQQPIQPAQLPPYPQHKFAENYPQWQKAIIDGTKTSIDILSFLASKVTLSPEQTALIRAVDTPVEAEVMA